MTKLLYITNGIHGAAGLERVLSIKACLLADEFDYDVHILTLNSLGQPLFYDFSSKIQLHDIQVSGNPVSYIKQYVSGVKKVIKEVQPDIISVCDDGLKAFFLPKINPINCAIIYERHVSKIIELGINPSFIQKMKVAIKFKLMNQLAKSFDRFVVLTNDNIAEWNLKNLLVVSNPLSFNPKESSSIEAKKVIAVGRQNYQKGFDLLLQSWQIINQKHPDWQLDIYGKLDKSLGLDKLARELNIEKSVFFHEPVKNIEQQYLASSIYALSSRYEGFGMVLIEAMVCGVPCVSYDCPCGPSDIIKNEEDGFLVKNGDYNEFASKINKLIEDDTLRKEMGRNAKQNVLRYLPETIVKQWDNLFNDLLK